MNTFLSSIFLFVLFIILISNIILLPANWIMLGLIFLWKVLFPNNAEMNTLFFLFLVFLVISGEIIEYVAQSWGSKRYGSSTSGVWVGLLGAFLGALFGLPFFLGFGAFIGALLGAWTGCYIMERINGKDTFEASHAAKGALIGRLLGIIVKLCIGISMLIMTYHTLFPSAVPIEKLYNL